MINKYDGSNLYVHMKEQGQRVKMNQPEVSSQSQKGTRSDIFKTMILYPQKT